jgi:drug/metabolite transporter (DMT)-like permease
MTISSHDRAISRNKPLLLMAGGVASLAALDAVTKWLTGGYDSWQLMWLTRIVSIVTAIFLCFRSTGSLFGLGTRFIRFHLVRGMLGIATAWCFYEALRIMPLADAVAIGFAAPLFMTALSGPLLQEKVSKQRWAAVSIGFVGVIVALRPAAGGFWALLQNPGPFFALGAALSYALLLLMLRRAGSREPSYVLLFWSQILPFVVAAPMAIDRWNAPSFFDWSLFALHGALGTAGTLLMIKAFRIGEASLLAPVEYTALIWSVLFGALFFNQLPGETIMLGAAIIVCAGLYLMREEKRTATPTEA